MLELRTSDYLTHTLNVRCVFAYCIMQTSQLLCTLVPANRRLNKCNKRNGKDVNNHVY